MYLNALKMVQGVGAARLYRLVAFFRSSKRAWEANRDELNRCLGQEKVAEAIVCARRSIDPGREWGRIAAEGINVTAPGLADYPQNLANTYAPPPLLFYRGGLQGGDLSVAIVGSRSSSPYGQALANSLAKDLASAGMLVVSGLARGIDAVAHRGALSAGGRTIAVLGSGLDLIYPREHRRLAQQIMDSGAVVTEFPLGSVPLSSNFPVRNRTIAGISLGTLVVEGKEKSGSLITADFALEHGRDVFALPGPVNAANSRGPHKLLKQGAKLVEVAADILEEYVHLLPEQSKTEHVESNYAGECRQLIDLLSLEPMHIDIICRKLAITPDKIAGLLIHLELAGLICQVSSGYYVINIS